MAGEQWGVLSPAELRGCGLSRRRSPFGFGMATFTASTEPCTRLVMRTLHSRAASWQRSRHVGAGAVLSHYSAAALWGLVTWDDRHPEVTVVGTAPREHRGIRVHRTRELPTPDVVRHEMINVTAPPRTLLDLASTIPYKALRRATRQAQALGRVNVPQLVLALSRAGRRPGAAKVRRIIASGPAPTRSELEDVVLDLILRGGLAHPDVNRPLLLDGRRVIPDFRWPEQQLVVEADGAAWHDNRARPRRRRRAASPARGSRRAGRPRHLAPGRYPAPPDARPAASRWCAPSPIPKGMTRATASPKASVVALLGPGPSKATTNRLRRARPLRPT